MCHQLEYTFRSPELRSVENTAVANDLSCLNEVDATAGTKKTHQRASVRITSFILKWPTQAILGSTCARYVVYPFSINDLTRD